MHKYISKIFKQLTALYIVDRKKKIRKKNFFVKARKRGKIKDGGKKYNAW